VRSEGDAFLVDGMDDLRTLPVWAFSFLSKGCSSQFWGIFWGGLWKRAGRSRGLALLQSAQAMNPASVECAYAETAL
jgi:hypothetical protein